MKIVKVLWWICSVAQLTAPQAASSVVMDGERVYRNNCTRLPHPDPHIFATHDGDGYASHAVRATLTSAERAAVLQYLLESSTPKQPRRKSSEILESRTQE